MNTSILRKPIFYHLRLSDSIKVVGATLVEWLESLQAFVACFLRHAESILTRKPTVTELNFQMNRIRSYIVRMKNHTVLPLIIWFFRFTLRLVIRIDFKTKSNVSSFQFWKIKIVTDQITIIALKSLFWPYFHQICVMRDFGTLQLVRKPHRGKF